ncbi:hypothetical protein GOBAR_AA27661 [Gossypium barbadense]|uniref:Uncharacterized protein n=1 Tax=Gossypium barbadense TaxID=3634 RepID=A0A2P5WPJ6_GOSBA|nr:hypothetical protein GOBAR_AA27661 [Gossypium barbadense]
MSSSRGKKAAVLASKKRKGASSFSGPTAKVRHPFLSFPIGPQEVLFQILRARPLITGRCIDWIAALLTTDPWELFFGIIEPTYFVIMIELCSTFHLRTVMTNYDDPGIVQFCLGGLVRQLSVPEFGTALGLYMEEFKDENDIYALNRHIHRSPSRCWDTLVSALPPSLRYLHAILAHTITRRRESTRVINTHDAYFLWCMSHGLLNTAAQESSLTLIGQMSPQGISSMLSMRMIEKCRGTYPPQYRLAQSTKEEAYEDIPDDVPPQHEDPPTQPPPSSRPVHAAASYADISECLTRFEQQCFQ